MVPVVPLSVVRVDFLSVWADERLLPEDPTVAVARLDVHGRRGGLVGGVVSLTMLVKRVVSVADLGVLEGDAPRLLAEGSGVRRTVCGGTGRLIGVLRVSGIGGI